MKGTWKVLVVSTVFLALAAYAFVHFLEFHEDRVRIEGWRFEDPVFSYLPLSDVSVPIFMITYGSVILYLFLNYKKEHFISRLMVTYAVILLLRMITLSLIPLKEPSALIFLKDPFLNNLIYPGKIVTDLFFSGHTALVFSIFILSGKRLVFLGLTLLMGSLLMIQRVHYSIDVLAAIPFAWLSASLTEILFSRLKKQDVLSDN